MSDRVIIGVRLRGTPRTARRIWESNTDALRTRGLRIGLDSFNTMYVVIKYFNNGNEFIVGLFRNKRKAESYIERVRGDGAKYMTRPIATDL